MVTCSSILAWKIPRTEEPGGLQSMGLQRVRHHLVTEHTHTRDFYGAKPNPENEKTALRFQSEVGAPWWHHDTIVGKIPRKKCNSPSVQFSSVAQSCLTLCDPMNHSTPGLPVHHHLLEFTQTHVHRVGDAIQPSHPLSSSFPPAPNPSQHQSLFQ